MMKTTRRLRLLASSAALLALAGCQRDQSTPTADEIDMPDPIRQAMPAPKDNRHTTAVAAKDALLASLSGRLMEVMQAEGAVAAIKVCSQEAVGIADAVGKQHGVQIGRTSFKLRNPKNAPREWMQRLVDEKTDTPQRVELDSGNLGVLFPIQLNVKCLMCHGVEGDILEEVKAELAERYPEDQATGFKQGDLRGWFWVEVPPDSEPDSETSQPAPDKPGPESPG